MRRVSPDEGPDAEDPVGRLGQGDPLGDERDFEGTGDLVDGQVGLLRARLGEGLQGAFEQAVGEEAVEPADHDADLEAFGLKLSLECFHVLHAPPDPIRFS